MNSGRDDNIIEAFRQAAGSRGSYPTGLFWFQRSDSAPCHRVGELLEEAMAAGIQAELIQIDTFDELLGDLLRQLIDIPAEIQIELDRTAARVSNTPIGTVGRGWPVIRTNALPFSPWPNMARLITCEIGGTKEVRDVITRAGAGVVAVRSRDGVLAFGSDSAIRQAFHDFNISGLDYRAIEPKKLHFDSAEMGLLRDAFELALAIPVSGSSESAPIRS